MKIKKSQLKRLINEELRNLLLEIEKLSFGPEYVAAGGHGPEDLAARFTRALGEPGERIDREDRERREEWALWEERSNSLKQWLTTELNPHSDYFRGWPHEHNKEVYRYSDDESADKTERRAANGGDDSIKEWVLTSKDIPPWVVQHDLREKVIAWLQSRLNGYKEFQSSWISQIKSAKTQEEALQTIEDFVHRTARDAGVLG